MFCRSCGNEIAETASLCMKCGVPAGKGSSYCPFCGQSTPEHAVMCVSCGRMLVAPEPQPIENQKSALAAGLFALFLGNFGVHDFYLGCKARGIIKILLSFVWLAVLMAMIPVAVTEEIIAVAIIVPLFFLSLLCAVAASIWSLVDAIMLLCGARKVDARGNSLKQI